MKRLILAAMIGSVVFVSYAAEKKTVPKELQF